MIKKILTAMGIDVFRLVENLLTLSVNLAVRKQKLSKTRELLRQILPDISQQENSEVSIGYNEIKRRSLQAFQCEMMLKVMQEQKLQEGQVTIVDIGDSSGAHLTYLQELTKDKYNLDTISVNLDPEAIKKIEKRGMKAVLSRAEDLDLGEQQIDFFTSFQMVEHLHNPAIFFRRLAKKGNSDHILVTVPYLAQSRVGLHTIRNNQKIAVHAEVEHVFELSPEDWSLLMLHSGWTVEFSKIYYQYPTRWPIISRFFRFLWKRVDFEGFWAVYLKRDLTQSDLYLDWEE